MSGIILFDGVCNLCNGSVQFIIKRDPDGYFQFASLQSQIGKELNRAYGIDENDSFILIENGKWYDKSSAAIQVAKRLKGSWKILFMGWLIPKPIRDYFYGVIAKNRYRWFGRRESCMIPTPEMKSRFLD